MTLTFETYPYNHWYLTNYNSDGVMTYSRLLYDIDETIGDADLSLGVTNMFMSSDKTVYFFSSDYQSGNDSIYSRHDACGRSEELRPPEGRVS